MFTVRLRETDRPALRMHFLALDAKDRAVRFGIIVGDAGIERYVEHIDFSRDAVFGVNAETRNFEGVAHLVPDRKHAELGLSVLPHYRGRGIGSALISRAAVHARNRQINLMFMQCLSENRAIIHIASALGMRVLTQSPDSEARMDLPPADPLSILSEMMDDGVALCDAVLRKTLLRHAPAAHEGHGKLSGGNDRATA